MASVNVTINFKIPEKYFWIQVGLERFREGLIEA